MSEQKPNHEVEGIVRRALRRDCVEAQISGRGPKHFCRIEDPPVAWNKFVTTKTLREVTKNPMDTLNHS
jgi:hypothetical protein